MANREPTPGGARPSTRPSKSSSPARPTVPVQNNAPTRAQPVAGTMPPPRAQRRPEMIRQRREERKQEYDKKRRQWFWTRLGLIAFAVIAVAGIGWLGYTLLRDQQLNQVPEGTNTAFNYVGGEHVAEGEIVPYAETPPVGGEHYAAWQNCGFYPQPIANENAVHSLEHGAVWITYRPDLPQDQIDILRSKAEQDYILVSPFPDLPAPVVASVWNKQIALDTAADERLDQFIRVFKEGPDTPERGALCTQGVGQPEEL